MGRELNVVPYQLINKPEVVPALISLSDVRPGPNDPLLCSWALLCRGPGAQRTADVRTAGVASDTISQSTPRVSTSSASPGVIIRRCRRVGLWLVKVGTTLLLLFFLFCCSSFSPTHRTRPGPRRQHDGASGSSSTHFRSHSDSLLETERGSERS